MTSSNLPLNLPPLENGDKLTRLEFEQRYAAMSHIKKAELIQGFVCMASPVPMTQHGNPHARIMAWLGAFWAANPEVQVGDNVTVRLDTDNEVQPDALLRMAVAGQSTIFPGLWLAKSVLLSGDLATVLSVL